MPLDPWLATMGTRDAQRAPVGLAFGDVVFPAGRRYTVTSGGIFGSLGAAWVEFLVVDILSLQTGG